MSGQQDISTEGTILWRRLDTPGHDACRLVDVPGGRRIAGATAYKHEAGVACLTYALDCDGDWRAQATVVQGWVGDESLDLCITRKNDAWAVNGEIAMGLTGCVDLDLAFTPATNLLVLRRLALSIGQAADVTVAWLDVPGSTLEPLQQRYERRSANTYWYESPKFGYFDFLEVDPLGFVRRYPTLWEAE